MMSQTAQALTARLGYAVPRLIAAAGLEADYRAAMQTAADAYEKLAAFNPEVAAYVVPNGYNRRLLLSTNLRSALHFIRLRTAPNAHFSVRRVAARMAEEIARTLPLFGPFLCPDEGETWQQVEAEHFVAV
jgi:thymidylate synthase ThyX